MLRVGYELVPCEDQGGHKTVATMVASFWTLSSALVGSISGLGPGLGWALMVPASDKVLSDAARDKFLSDTFRTSSRWTSCNA